MSITQHFATSTTAICTIADGANSDVWRIPPSAGVGAVFKKVMSAQYSFWVEYESVLLSAIHENIPDEDLKHVVASKGFSKENDAEGNKTFSIETYDAGVDLLDWASTAVLINNQIYQNIFCHPASLVHGLRGCLQALYAIHQHDILHLDIKANNICIPLTQISNQNSPITLDFSQTTLIDFGFSLWWSQTPLGEKIKYPLGFAKGAEDKGYQAQSLVDALKSQKRITNQVGKTVFDHSQLKALNYSADLFSLGHLFDYLYREYKQHRLASDAGKWQLIDRTLSSIIEGLLQFDTGLYGFFDYDLFPHTTLIDQLSKQLTKLNATDTSLTIKLYQGANTTPISPQNSPLAAASKLAKHEEITEPTQNTDVENDAKQTADLKNRLKQIQQNQQTELAEFTSYNSYINKLLNQNKLSAQDTAPVENTLTQLSQLYQQINNAKAKYPDYFTKSKLNGLYTSFNPAYQGSGYVGNVA